MDCNALYCRLRQINCTGYYCAQPCEGAAHCRHDRFRQCASFYVLRWADMPLEGNSEIGTSHMRSRIKL